MKLTLAIGALVFTSASAAGGESLSLSPELQEACAEPGVECAVRDDLFVLAEKGNADRLADEIAAAMQRFQRHFGEMPARTASIAGNSRYGELRKALRASGFKVGMPSIVREEQLGMLMEQVKLGDADQVGAIQSVALSSTADLDRAAGHEFGHLWFVQRFTPNTMGAGRHYGGSAPDWLDETAAVLMEEDALAETRRTGFRRVYGESGVSGTIPLERFVAMDHPMKGMERALTKSVSRTTATNRAGPVSAIQNIRISDPEIMRDASAFYLKAWSFQTL